MLIVAIGVVWVGYLVVSWGAHMIAPTGDPSQNPGLVDLAVPGHYAATHGGSLPSGPVGTPMTSGSNAAPATPGQPPTGRIGAGKGLL